MKLRPRLRRTWLWSVETVKPLLLLAVIVAVAIAVALTAWSFLGQKVPQISDRTNAALALATVLLASLTVWSTMLNQREMRRSREYEAHVSLQPKVVWFRVGPRTAFGPGARDFGEYPDRPVGVILDFRAEIRRDGAVAYQDVSTRFDLSLYNNGRGAAHNMRVVDAGVPCGVSQTPAALSLGAGDEVALAIVLVGNIPHDQLVLLVEYEDPFGRPAGLQIELRCHRLLERDDTVTERWTIERYRTK